jgi:hypothetical protein
VNPQTLRFSAVAAHKKCYPMVMSANKESMEFALANRTGAGFSGDLGYLSAKELATEAGLIDAETGIVEAQTILDEMVASGEALTDNQGNYSGVPVQCVVCNADPCTCGIGTWRT